MRNTECKTPQILSSPVLIFNCPLGANAVFCFTQDYKGTMHTIFSLRSKGMSVVHWVVIEKVVQEFNFFFFFLV